MMDRIATLFTVFLLFWKNVEVQSLLKRGQLLNNLTNSATYDREFSAYNDKDIPTVVIVQLDVSEVTSIDEQKMEYSVLMFVRMQWEDNRLAFNDTANFTRLELTGDMVDKIWTPDVYTSNERQVDSHSFVKHREELAYIDPNGIVSVSMRISMTGYCLMKFNKYPFDTQTCTVTLQSYAFTSDKIMLQCSENGVIKKHFDLANYDVEVRECEDNVDKDDRRSLVAGQFSHVSGNLIFRRKPKAYVVMYFVSFPIYFLIALFSFWFKEMGTRNALCTGGLLATVLQWIGIYTRLPPVWYFKYLDGWILFHIIIVLAILLFNVYLQGRGIVHKVFKDKEEEKDCCKRNKIPLISSGVCFCVYVLIGLIILLIWTS